jgi:hypothetical protein
MAETGNYSRQFRSLGQQLEDLGMERFTVRVEVDGYRVTGTKRYQPPAEEQTSKKLWQRIRRGAKSTGSSPQPFEPVELHFSAQDLAHFDVGAQHKRSGTPGGADAHSLSQVFRAVGAIVEQKQGRFLSVIKEGQEIVIEYESISKRNTVEKFTVSSLYDYWVKMYLRRRERS